MKIEQVWSAVRNFMRSMLLLGFVSSIGGVVAQQANAEVIDQIEINQVGDQAEIKLHFITRIQYKRQVTLKNGDVRIYFSLLNIDANDPRLIWERKDSPPSDIVPPFTVTYPELDSALTLSFGKVIKNRVRPGKDGQSLSITTKVLLPKKANKETVVSPLTQGATKLPIAAAAAAVTSAIAAVNAETAASSNASAVLPDSKVEGAGFPTDLPPESQRTPAQIQKEAQQEFVSASDALQNNRIDDAIESLNKVLNLPPNELTQATQELMGEAREKGGEYVKARAEYELYLKLYPNAADAKFVQARIANLPKDDAVKQVQVTAQSTDDKKLKVTGGITQNYYHGNSNTDTFDTTNTNPQVNNSLLTTDQSQLVTSLDMMAQKRTDSTDTRVVLREFNRINFLPNQPEEYRWDAVYLEQNTRDRNYMYRLGRQYGASGGVPGRFDGLAAGYSINSTWRLNAAIGRPVEYYTGSDVPDSKTFYSGSVELTRLPDQWSGSAYGIIQYVGGGYKSGGIRDRTALGVEAHYFDSKRSYLTQTEYDIIYHKVNLVTFQGNWSHESGMNYYMTVDHRRSPPLALNLSGQYTQSVKQLLTDSIMDVKVLRDNSIALSQISNMFSIGMSRPYSSKLRLATDFHVSNTGGTGSAQVVDPNNHNQFTTPQSGSLSSGNTYSWSAQAIGNNLMFENDLGIASYTFTSSSAIKANTLGFTQVETFKQKWRGDVSLQLSSQNGSGTNTSQITPSLTLNYRSSDKLSFSANVGADRQHVTTAGVESKTFRKYFFMGYRWDFR